MAQEYARKASQSFAVSLQLARHKNAEADVLEALKSRTTIDLTWGSSWAKLDANQQQAVETLKSASSSRNIKLREIATGRVGPDTSEGSATNSDR